MKQDDEIDLMSWITKKREEGYLPGFEDTSTAVIFYYDKDKNMIPVSTQKASLVLSPHRMSKEEYGYLISGFKEKNSSLVTREKCLRFGRCMMFPILVTKLLLEL